MKDQKNGRRHEAVGRSSPTARPCDGCRLVQSVVYCHSDAKYLCVPCDKQVHSANQVASRHERVHVCEVCKSASTVLTCCADATALCIACDAKVHSANTLTQRHQRVPVLPLPAAAIPAPSGFDKGKAVVVTHGIREEEEEMDSWLLLTEDSDYSNCTNSTATANNNSDKKMVFGDVDQYFDLSGYNPYYHSDITRNPEEQYRMQEQQQIQKRYQEKEWSECVAPSQLAMVYEQQQSVSGIGGAKNAASVTSSIPLSSMEAGIVPDNTMAGISNLNILTGGVDILPVHSFQMPAHLSPRNKAARILRYNEKRQARKFDKTIRYTTRKAYAEARP